jgi:hypothetical protein
MDTSNLNPEPQKALNDYIGKGLLYWSKYNQAKCNEKALFYILLDELCNLVPEPYHDKGRKPFPLRDLLFCSCLKLNLIIIFQQEE